ncbi:MAG: hypothetical protein GX131_13525 [candidate division WS1 bacterium]|jgi:gas vesicle protein|nr:hypothetical protein [candidate division WS1 bacterium]
MTNGDNGDRDALAIFGAMVLGALLGGLAALLLAPKSGQELRGDIGDAATRAKGRAEDMKGQVAQKYEDLRESVETHLKEHAHTAAEKTEEFAKGVEERAKQAEEGAHEAKEKTKA